MSYPPGRGPPPSWEQEEGYDYGRDYNRQYYHGRPDNRSNDEVRNRWTGAEERFDPRYGLRDNHEYGDGDWDQQRHSAAPFGREEEHGRRTNYDSLGPPSSYARDSLGPPSSYARDSLGPPSYARDPLGPPSYARNLPPPPSFERSMPKEKQDILYGRTADQTIEIAPGVRLRLRGADETWRAVERDFYSPCECFGCSTTIFCIQDAEYVICPLCKVVGPIGSDGHGVGLGFTMEDLARWQEDIVSNHARERASGFG